MKIFWDFDGTLYEFLKVGPDKWMAAGYSKTLNLLSESIAPALFTLSTMPNDLNGELIENYLLSAVVSDQAIEDKIWRINEDALPIPSENMIFVPYGKSKAEAIKEKGIEVKKGDLFIDDYTPNLNEMDSLMTCVKMLNGINDTNRSWRGSRISAFSAPMSIVRDLLAISYADTVTDIAA